MMATVNLLNLDVDMIERMEVDLATKARDAFVDAAIDPSVHGVFSIDDLQNKSESDLCQKIAVGVGYAGSEPTNVSTNPKSPLNVGSSNAVKALDFIYTIILAVPTGAECVERYNATKLLTVLRMRIMGSTVSDDAANRKWAFVKESPDIQASTDTMLYYLQVWRVELIATGPR